MNDKFFFRLTLFWMLAALSSCGNNDPVREDIPEMITQVKLSFASQTGSHIVVTATDPDGEGVQSITVNSPIELTAGTTYTMTISLINDLAEPTGPDYDVSKEVEAEGDEHMFYFSWTGSLFSNPAGPGNIDSRSNPVNYTGSSNSTDSNNLPLGLTTTWTTALNPSSGSFRVLLKHQPGLKSEFTGSDVGETDLDVTFDITVR